MPAREPEALVLDAMGVLYAEGNLVEAHVIPFARGHGSRLADRDILTAYLRCSAGDMSSAEFWRTVGVTGNATDLDAAYVKLHRLMPKPTRDDLDSETFLLGSSTWQDSTHPVARTFDDVAALLNVDAGDGGS
jgi:hypothetical protein